VGQRTVGGGRHSVIDMASGAIVDTTEESSGTFTYQAVAVDPFTGNPNILSSLSSSMSLCYGPGLPGVWPELWV
jgi:hypothetical protein